MIIYAENVKKNQHINGEDGLLWLVNDIMYTTELTITFELMTNPKMIKYKRFYKKTLVNVI